MSPFYTLVAETAVDAGLQGLVAEMKWWYTQDGTGRDLVVVEGQHQIYTWMTDEEEEVGAVRGNHRDIAVELKAMDVAVQGLLGMAAVEELLEDRKVDLVEEMRLRQSSTGDPVCYREYLVGKVVVAIAAVSVGVGVAEDILDIAFGAREKIALQGNASYVVEHEFDLVVNALAFALGLTKDDYCYGFVPLKQLQLAVSVASELAKAGSPKSLQHRLRLVPDQSRAVVHFQTLLPLHWFLAC